jgi:hypothetical protein
LEGSIVSDSSGGSNCYGAIADRGHNVVSDASCGFTQPTSMSGIDPLLAPLALNAPGMTRTHALKPGSPAIGAGPTTVGDGGCPPSDQRGVSRIAYARSCDVGAYEIGDSS